MADLTTAKLQAEISASKDYNTLDQKTWETNIAAKQIQRFDDGELTTLIKQYTESISKIRSLLRETGLDIKVVPMDKDGKVKDSATIVAEMNAQMKSMNDFVEQEKHLLDKLACCLKQQEIVKAGG
jgi:hypothetical protein